MSYDEGVLIAEDNRNKYALVFDAIRVLPEGWQTILLASDRHLLLDNNFRTEFYLLVKRQHIFIMHSHATVGNGLTD